MNKGKPVESVEKVNRVARGARENFRHFMARMNQNGNY